jgi:DNA-binding NarL/FixJ family response regulator
MKPTSMLTDKGAVRDEKEMARPRKPKQLARRQKRLRPVEEEEILTARELEVLGCFAQGLNTAVVARRLSISPTTVRNHAQHILAKLHVHSRLQAVARAYATGLLSVSAADPDPRARGKAGRE